MKKISINNLTVIFFILCSFSCSAMEDKDTTIVIFARVKAATTNFEIEDLDLIVELRGRDSEGLTYFTDKKIFDFKPDFKPEKFRFEFQTNLDWVRDYYPSNMCIVLYLVKHRTGKRLLKGSYCGSFTTNQPNPHIELYRIPNSEKYVIDERNGIKYSIKDIGGVYWTLEDVEYKNYDSWCPKGWHLPEQTDWIELLEYFGCKPDIYNNAAQYCENGLNKLEVDGISEINLTNGLYLDDWEDGVEFNFDFGFYVIMQIYRNTVKRCRCVRYPILH